MEVFYRSLKRTMEKHKLHSASPQKAEVELDWALMGLWMLGLMTVQRMITRRISPSRWSVAESLRVTRRVMSGCGGRRWAKDLCALCHALKDQYKRSSTKTARNWPHKKQTKPPDAPKIRTASRQEKQAAKGLREKQDAA